MNTIPDTAAVRRQRSIPLAMSTLALGVLLPAALRAQEVQPAGASEANPVILPVADERETSAERSRGIREIRKKAVVLRKGESTEEARRAAWRALPLARLAEADRTRVAEIVGASSLFRSLPTIAVETDPVVHRYFAEHPEVAVGIWRALDISKFRMRRVGATSFVAGTGDGTEGTLDVLHQTPHETLLICDGAYLSTFLPKPVEAKAVLHLRAKFDRGPDGAERAVHQLNMFVAFPSQTVETAARIVSPISNLIIDRNFQEVSLFLHMMTLAMSKRPDWVGELSQRLEDVPDPARRSLLEVTGTVYVRARKRTAEVMRGQSPERTAERNRSEAQPPVSADGRYRRRSVRLKR